MLGYAPFLGQVQLVRLGQQEPVRPPSGYQQIFPKTYKDLMVGDFANQFRKLVLITDRTEGRLTGVDPFGSRYSFPFRGSTTLDIPIDEGGVYYRATSKELAIEEVQKVGGNVDMVWETELRKPSAWAYVAVAAVLGGVALVIYKS